jgi:pimeloyl-ACP methyl ester carboxylesterase
MYPMTASAVPVILVHGWNSHPGVWNRLVPRLEAAHIPCSRFSHVELANETLPDIAGALRDHIRQYRTKTGYCGAVDIVCHSVGTCITRYFLEVMDREHREHVRQLIGLGPPNNGSALAELFHDPEQGARIINRLTGVFVPRGFNPDADTVVQDVRPESRVMAELRTAGIRQDITYRVIVTANPDGIPGFFPLFAGRTWEIGADGRYRMTLDGDGVVAHSESLLPGISLDIIPPSPDASGRYPQPDLFCHINLPKNHAVIDRIMHYLQKVPVETEKSI